MATLPIVEHLDELEDRGPCLGWTLVVGVVDELGLQRSKEALPRRRCPSSWSVGSSSIRCRWHRAGAPVVGRSVLTAAVRVMHQQLGPRPVGQGHAQGVQREFPGEAIRHRPSDHPARVQVKHHRQVQPATARPHVGDVRCPLAVLGIGGEVALPARWLPPGGDGPSGWSPGSGAGAWSEGPPGASDALRGAVRLPPRPRPGPGATRGLP